MADHQSCLVMADTPLPHGRWSSGPSIDGKSQFTMQPAQPFGEVPVLAPADLKVHPQKEQMVDGGDKSLLDKAADFIKGE